MFNVYALFFVVATGTFVTLTARHWSDSLLLLLNICTELNLVRMILVYRVTTLCKHHHLKLTCKQRHSHLRPVRHKLHTLINVTVIAVDF